MKYLKLFLIAALMVFVLGSNTSKARKLNKVIVPNRNALTTSLPQCEGKIAFTSYRDLNGNGDIYVMDADGGNPTRITNHNATDREPEWSPDGTRIVFQSDRDNLINSRPDIYVMNADGSNVTRLTTSLADDEFPAWSPDGTRIAFTSSKDTAPGGTRHLYVMNADGSNQTRLTFNSLGVNSEISWSPDGSRIAFSKITGSFQDAIDIYTIEVATGVVFQVTHADREGVQFTGAVWSPDAQKMAVARKFVTDGEVFLMKPDGTDQINLTHSAGLDSSPAWSRDGSAIVFESTRDGNQETYIMNPDGTGQKNLTNNTAPDYRPTLQMPQSSAPCLLAEAGTEHAVAFDSVTFLRDPFKVVTSKNFSSDQRTRITIFAKNVRVLPGDDAAAFTVQAENAQHQIFPLTVESVGKTPDYDWLTQLTVKLPDGLIGAGDVKVSVTLHGTTSNQGTINIAP